MSKTKHALWIIGCLALLVNMLSYMALFCKGEAIDLLSRRTATVREGIILCLIFGGIQILSGIFQMVLEALKVLTVSKSFMASWNQFLPLRIEKHVAAHGSAFYNHVYGTLPKLSQLRIDLVIEACLVTSIISIFVGKAIHDGLWLILLFLPFIILTAHMSSLVYRQSYLEKANNIIQDRSVLISWVERYFKANKELYVNWRASENNGAFLSWYSGRGRQIYENFLAQARIHFKRDVIGSLLVDWPFIICSVLIIIAAFQGLMSPGDVLIWLGLTDYLVSASLKIKAIKDTRSQIHSLTNLIDQDLGWIREATAIAGSEDEVEPQSFALLDGSQVNVGISPGFYHIAGANGSGKSTLVETLIGFNRHYKKWPEATISSYRSFLHGRTRLIDREAVIFPEWNSFEEQIFGVLYDKQQSMDRFARNLRHILGQELSGYWLEKIAMIGEKWEQRVDRNLSTGERVTLAFARCLSNWDSSVRVIVADECDSNLDATTRSKFIETLDTLAQKHAVYMISHRSMHPDLPESSVTTEVILIGFGEESRQASLVPTKVSAIFPGHGRIIGVDSESKKLESAMELARACLLTLRPQLRILNSCDYYISAQTHGKAIGDPRSASLGFVIGLVNILLILAQRQPLVGVASTGAVDIDGTVLPVSWVSEKVEAASQVPFVKQIYTPDNVKHVEDVLHQFSFG